MSELFVKHHFMSLYFKHLCLFMLDGEQLYYLSQFKIVINYFNFMDLIMDFKNLCISS